MRDNNVADFSRVRDARTMSPKVPKTCPTYLGGEPQA